MTDATTDGFVGRDAELRHLHRAYDSNTSEFIAVHGRRRVGKTELILQSLQRYSGLYFMGKEAPPVLQLDELLREAAHALDEPRLASLHTRSWKEALTAIASAWHKPSKLILVLDEFQWMVAASPELPGVLQELWDRQWHKAGNVTLVLCGSLASFKAQEIFADKSPLFSRCTRQLRLRPLPYHEAARFYPGWSLVERARAYFVCGGIPAYLRRFDPACSVEQNLIEQLFDKSATLIEEPDLLLHEGLRDVYSYYAVLQALAAGNHTAAAIAAFADLPERSLPYYLQQLDELGYLARHHPLNGAKVPKRLVRYVLEDPLLRFWFRFVFPNRSFIEQVGPRRAFKERIAPELAAYEGICFERLCREALPLLYRAEGIAAAFEIGEYWDKRVQLDVVGVRDDGWADLGECRFGTVRSVPALRRELEAKVAAWPNERGATIQRRLFVRKKPARVSDSPQERWHDLEDLHAAAAER